VPIDHETDERLWALTSQVTGLRDVVARLLAYNALGSTDTDRRLKHFAEATSHQIYQVEKASGKQLSADAMLAQEQIQAEVDLIVTQARIMLGAAQID
jgi:hypothetical protein